MGKGNNKRGQRRRGDDSESDEEGDDIKNNNNSNNINNSNGNNSTSLDFKERRALERLAAAEKRRLKMKCHLCGQTGHVRRECPGLDDDGRGESKYTKSKGDPGSINLKAHSKKGQRGSRKGGDHGNSGNNGNSNGSVLILPAGFEPVSAKESNDTDADADTDADSFRYLDAGCNASAGLQYLQTGRRSGGAAAAVQEYMTAVEAAVLTSNHGGCICPVHLKPNPADWSASHALPLPWSTNGSGGGSDNNRDTALPPVWLVVGLDPVGWDTLLSTADREIAAVQVLTQAVRADPDRVVGVCCSLDYTLIAPAAATAAAIGGSGAAVTAVPTTTPHDFNDTREAQLARAKVACQAAVQANVPVQLHAVHAMPGNDDNDHDGDDEDNNEINHFNDDPMRTDLNDMIAYAVSISPTVKVHLSCWSGTGDDMCQLLLQYPDNVYIGLDGTVTFSKAAAAHACAFDVPLDKLLLETGTNIPSQVAAAVGRDAFPHSGWIPYTAAAVAQQKKIVTAAHVARMAAINTRQLYRLLPETKTSALN
jgi:Tat protein secretion system quality control protein TatD with DNase activity